MKKRTIAALVALPLAAIIGLAGCDTSDSPPAATQTVEDANLQDRLTDALGEDRLESAIAAGGETVVRFKISDNLTDAMRASTAQRDTVKIIRAVEESPDETAGTRLSVWGVFPTTDQYGNTNDTVVLTVAYSAETRAKLNLDNPSLQETVWDVAEDEPKLIHRQLRG